MRIDTSDRKPSYKPKLKHSLSVRSGPTSVNHRQALVYLSVNCLLMHTLWACLPPPPLLPSSCVLSVKACIHSDPFNFCHIISAPETTVFQRRASRVSRPRGSRSGSCVNPYLGQTDVHAAAAAAIKPLGSRRYLVSAEVCYVCLLSSAPCTTAGVGVVGLTITASRQTDATRTRLGEIRSRDGGAVDRVSMSTDQS